ncbi:DUF6702 family protein [Epilithonimonas xixisoli]|uniref:M penetrans family 1 protein n=1 Tax=Epilithonimonas xixisoli TaxID=1476462 RepID=A0A4R8I5M6_9FLAO|nr:DUF6702 family protein [Epilithonimonas xixisoli]TDX84217.1 hypothetical protein B0I22_1820 [Epilithonimonas xixisoli]
MKKYLLILAAGLLMISFFSFKDFDFFSSMTKVDYIDGTKTLKFTTKLNTTHISQAVKIDPATAGFEAEVKKYVNNNMDVAINGAPKSLTFTGSQVNGESVWVYYEAGNVSDISSLKIKNSILIGQFPKQVNIVNITYKGTLKTLNFQKGKETSEVSY